MSTAVILAGGRSTRFDDRDKAVADLAGTPMIRRVADAVDEAVDAVVINCRTDQRAAIESAMTGSRTPVRYAEDERPDEGPVAGMLTGLRAVDTEYAFVVACDMPFVQTLLIEYLFERAAGHDAAVPRLDDGWFQTTQAVYRAAAMADACEATLDANERKVTAALDRIEYVTVGEAAIREHASLRTFENINTREELAEAAATFEQ
ncbi:molybdenum cofactor guanylyltransferase [Natranaeroarchaeum aerophilus]|uniref:Probable molybdenum cofactor guanylyltransferase n=1 Tax=Natranaeroarchaeum aerophilus TaxID=2917711 RepID=A0AAE3FRX4_9EURY|nr:molybdenum cofactor guanylyltransferase [Natranaeroarchaeum aerophilus]MCL9814056.1 molybdenum cofactor guanylyltransferase [Natranaeroarchaeum aerophilus]